MPTSRAYLSAASVGGKLYAIGGDAGGSLGTVEEYDPTSNSWTSKASMSPRAWLGCAVVNGRIYAAGGSNGVVMQAYDPLINVWETLPAVPTPRSALSVVTVQGQVLLLGGAVGVDPVTTVEAYDPVSRTWSSLESLPSPRSHAAAASVDDSAFLIGGFEGGYLFTNERYAPMIKQLFVHQRN
jgi:N-acetylneuraminic acid mutarotase